MKIDRSTIDALLRMNDEQLYKTIQYVARRSGHEGLNLPNTKEGIAKIRALLSSLSEDDINKMLEQYKKGIKNERK